MDRWYSSQQYELGKRGNDRSTFLTDEQMVSMTWTKKAYISITENRQPYTNHQFENATSIKYIYQLNSCVRLCRGHPMFVMSN